MNEEKEKKLEKLASDLIKSPIVKYCDPYYTIELLPWDEELLIWIDLRERNGKIVDVVELTVNPDGCAKIHQVLDAVVNAFEAGLLAPNWRIASEILRARLRRKY